MMTLAEALSKWQTIEGLSCLSCGNAWFFDKGRRHACTTCGSERTVYEITEDMGGYSTSTGALITSDTRAGIEQGIAAYFERYLPAGYGTCAGEIKEVSPGKFQVRVTRGSSCE